MATKYTEIILMNEAEYNELLEKADRAKLLADIEEVLMNNYSETLVTEIIRCLKCNVRGLNR